ncbi:MAG: amidase family protein, partial [Candidatus Paceibacterota bacterium]
MFKDLTIKNLREKLLNKEFTSSELTKHFFETINEKEKDVKSFLSLLKDDAYNKASEVDVNIEKGGDISNTIGAPIAVKDNLLIKGTKTTAGSKILKNYTASYDATVI